MLTLYVSIKDLQASLQEVGAAASECVRSLGLLTQLRIPLPTSPSSGPGIWRTGSRSVR